MKKAEMEAYHAAYQARMTVAREAESNGLFRAVIRAAISAWPNIDGMMQYESKYGNGEVANIWAIDAVLNYAPLLLDFRSLDALEDFFETCRRIERRTSVNAAARVADARSRLRDNHRLWTHIDAYGEVRQDELAKILGGDQDQWRWVAETWAKMGLVRRAPKGGSYLLSLSMRMGQIVSAKCPMCGKFAEAPKAMFFDELACPECRSKVLFVLSAMPTYSPAPE